MKTTNYFLGVDGAQLQLIDLGSRVLTPNLAKQTALSRVLTPCWMVSIQTAEVTTGLAQHRNDLSHGHIFTGMPGQDPLRDISLGLQGFQIL